MTTRRIEYPPGHFLALVREHNWPPGFTPQGYTPDTFGPAGRAEASQRGRETALANGHTGAIHGISKRADAQIQATKARFNRRENR